MTSVNFLRRVDMTRLRADGDDIVRVKDDLLILQSGPSRIVITGGFFASGPNDNPKLVGTVRNISYFLDGVKVINIPNLGISAAGTLRDLKQKSPIEFISTFLRSDPNVHLSDGADKALVSGVRVKFLGQGGADTIFGGALSDNLLGGSGNDRLIEKKGGDVLKGENGHDFLRGDGGGAKGTTHRDELFGGSGRDSLFGGASNDELFGGDGNDKLFGGAGNDKMEGEAGRDILKGEGGNDRIRGGDQNDQAFGGAGEDTIEGGEGNDRLEGGGGKDTLRGEEGNDTLLGGKETDRLFGGDGDDLLIGGAGADRFVFSYGEGHDTVADFEDNFDQLVFDVTPDDLAAREVTQVGDDVEITVASVKVTILNATVDQFTDTDFIQI